METPLSLHKNSPAEIKERLAILLDQAVTINRHSGLVERATVAQVAARRTLECINALEKSIDRAEGHVDVTTWVKEIQPIIKFAAHHVPESLEHNLILTEELRDELAKNEGREKELFTTILAGVDHATERHNLLFGLILEVNGRFLEGLTKQKN